MPTLSLSKVPADQLPTATYGAALLLALARDEVVRNQIRRLTEPDLATWDRFRGRLGPSHLLQLLVEDAAVLRPIPFDEGGVLGPALPHLQVLPDSLVQGWIEQLGQIDLAGPAADYILTQAGLLGLPTKFARADLHKVKPHQKVLELPGTGGQLAHHIVTTQPGIYLQDNFFVACGTWPELTLAGLVALDLGAPKTAEIHLDPDLGLARQETRRTDFDFVIGLAA